MSDAKVNPGVDIATPVNANPVVSSGYGKIGVVPKENEVLTHVGFGTPMGELMRRYWQPVCVSGELNDLPKKIKILGEELVAFRNKSGEAAIMDLHCAHRGASLEYGRIEDKGIRCCYHSWYFANDGRCLDQPGEPKGSTYKDEVCQPAYPVIEFGGLVFAYMGPPDKMPVFPLYDCWDQENTVLSGFRNYTRGVVAECNWLQIQENMMDPSHTAFLHATISTNHFDSEVYAAIPELDFEETDAGMKYTRTSLQANGTTFIRVNEVMIPNVRALARAIVKSEPHKIKGFAIGWWVPVDDTHTIGFHIEALQIIDGKVKPSNTDGAPIGRTSKTTPGRNSYEDTQREPDDCEAQVSQRPVAVHALEHRGQTDSGIVMFRKLLTKALRDMQAGRDPKGIVRDPAKLKVKCVSGNEVRPAAAK